MDWVVQRFLVLHWDFIHKVVLAKVFAPKYKTEDTQAILFVEVKFIDFTASNVWNQTSLSIYPVRT